MVDDELGTIGIEGLEIRARRWFTTHRGFTNSKGEFSCNGRFRGTARYRLDWERYHFALRSGGFSSAEKRGPKGRSNWNWHITGGEHKYYATIFRAAYHYYYKDIKGLRRPKQNSFWRSQLRIGAWTRGSDGNGTHQSTNHFAGLVTGVKIYTYNLGSVGTYATTIHELAHSAHYENRNWRFSTIDKKVKESWARGVQWELTRMVYPNYLGRERIKITDYTLVVADMIDDFSTDSTNKGYGYESHDKLEDQVSGYTIKEIENAMIVSKTFNDWKNNMKQKYDNPTEKYLDTLFKQYE